MVNGPPTIGGVEWAMGWNRKSDRMATLHAQRIAADALGALRVGVLVLDDTDRPVLANPAAVELGLVREGSQAHQVHAVIRTLAGQVRPCLLYTSPSPRDGLLSRMPSSA